MASQPTTQEIKDYIVQSAKAKGIDPDQALALAGVESSYNPTAVSKTGAYGVYQMFPAASKDAGYDYDKVKSDWKTNIDAGLTYYGQKLNESGGDVATALGYWNQGKNGFSKQLKQGQLAPEVSKFISHPAFAPFVNDDLNKTGNPIKPLLAQQSNANKFDTGALFRKNIDNQPTQADISATVANPNEPLAEQTNLADQIRQQRLETSKQLQAQREQQNSDLENERNKSKTQAINQAATFLVSSILGANRNTTTTVSGQDAGKRAGAQYGNQSATVLSNLQQQFNPNAFNSRFGGNQ